MKVKKFALLAGIGILGILCHYLFLMVVFPSGVCYN